MDESVSNRKSQQFFFGRGDNKRTFVIQFRLVVFEIQLHQFYFLNLLLLFLRLYWPPNGQSGS
jgi:hypothetical protein